MQAARAIRIHRIAILSLLAALPVAAGCSYGELSVEGKLCDADRPCPAGLICVLRPVSATEVEGTCYEPGDAPACPAEFFCGPDGAWVEECTDGHSSQVAEECTENELCNPYSGTCSPTCSAETDCAASETCELGLGLCLAFPSCSADPCPAEEECVTDSVCLGFSDQAATTASGEPGLDCFIDAPPDPPDTPATCDLTGRVYLFPTSASERTVGLAVVLRAAGDPASEVQLAQVDEDPLYPCGEGQCGRYLFEDVPTNQLYDIEISAGTSDFDARVVTTVRAGVALRADACFDGQFSLSLAAMSEANFEKYNASVFPGLSDGRALLIGVVQDCGNAQGANRKYLANATAALAIVPPEPGRVYYFADESILRPDTSLAATTHKGYYAAAGVLPCRNTVAFGAYLGGQRTLGSVSFCAQPDSVVIVNLPLPDENLQ